MFNSSSKPTMCICNMQKDLWVFSKQMVLSATLKTFDMSRPKIPLSHYTKLIVQINYRSFFKRKELKNIWKRNFYNISIVRNRIGFPFSVKGIFCKFLAHMGFQKNQDCLSELYIFCNVTSLKQIIFMHPAILKIEFAAISRPMLNYIMGLKRYANYYAVLPKTKLGITWSLFPDVINS